MYVKLISTDMWNWNRKIAPKDPVEIIIIFVSQRKFPCTEIGIDQNIVQRQFIVYFNDTVWHYWLLMIFKITRGIMLQVTFERKTANCERGLLVTINQWEKNEYWFLLSIPLDIFLMIFKNKAFYFISNYKADKLCFAHIII